MSKNSESNVIAKRPRKDIKIIITVGAPTIYGLVGPTLRNSTFGHLGYTPCRTREETDGRGIFEISNPSMSFCFFKISFQIGLVFRRIGWAVSRKMSPTVIERP